MLPATIHDFKNKVAFITGASTGIGRATATAFAQSGAIVVVADVNMDAGLLTVNRIEEEGGRALFLKCDVSKASEVKEALDQTVTRFGRVDFAFNNAGIEGTPAPTQDCTDENWDRTININLKGVWNCMRYQIPLMLKQGGGAIVNCSSIAGLVGFPGMPAYVASKHGVVGLTRVAALENAKTNIRVNAICPGVIRTPMIDRFTQGNKEAEKALVLGEPMGRMGEPEEIASVAMWLCSQQASFITGQALAVDGGWVAQ